MVSLRALEGAESVAAQAIGPPYTIQKACARFSLRVSLVGAREERGHDIFFLLSLFFLISFRYLIYIKCVVEWECEWVCLIQKNILMLHSWIISKELLSLFGG